MNVSGCTHWTLNQFLHLKTSTISAAMAASISFSCYWFLCVQMWKTHDNNNQSASPSAALQPHHISYNLWTGEWRLNLLEHEFNLDLTLCSSVCVCVCVCVCVTSSPMINNTSCVVLLTRLLNEASIWRQYFFWFLDLERCCLIDTYEILDSKQTKVCFEIFLYLIYFYLFIYFFYKSCFFFFVLLYVGRKKNPKVSFLLLCENISDCAVKKNPARFTQTVK